MIIPPNCPECKKQTKIFRNVTVSAVNQVYFYCVDCQRRPYPGQCISHKNFTQQEIESFPILENYLIQYGESCAVCQKPGSEYHHTAPRYIFGEIADRYPGIYLCLEHHRLWHDTVDQHYGKPERKSYD